MSDIQHQPWIGDFFPTTVPRLLILGESHHGDDPDAVDMTVPVVEQWLSGVSNPAYRFFTHLAVALSGQEPWHLDRRAVFRPIAFYNFVKAVMPASRVAPTRSDFVRSEAAFREVIERLRPTHVVACGKRLWEAMPEFDPPDSKGHYALLDGQKFHLGRYRTANAEPLTLCIKHPQSGFNGRIWYPKLQHFLSTS